MSLGHQNAISFTLVYADFFLSTLIHLTPSFPFLSSWSLLAFLLYSPLILLSFKTFSSALNRPPTLSNSISHYPLTRQSHEMHLLELYQYSILIFRWKFFYKLLNKILWDIYKLVCQLRNFENPHNSALLIVRFSPFSDIKSVKMLFRGFLNIVSVQNQRRLSVTGYTDKSWRLKVVGNEKEGGSRRWHMIDIGLGPWW
jgi:hypothetical protein